MKTVGSLHEYREWLSQRLRARTVELYFSILYSFFMQYGFKLDDITDEQLEEYVRNGMGQGEGSKSACVCRRSALVSFSKFMRKEYGVEFGRNLMDIDMPRPKHRIPECMTQMEIRQMMDAAKDVQERAMWEVLYCCGLRNGELCDLKYGNVDLDEMELTVIGKGDKQRKCYLTKSAVDSLAEYIATRNGWDDDEYLFTGISRKKLRDSTVYLKFRDCAKRAGIARKVHPHMMRHSFATKLLKNGVDLMTIRDMLGHESVTTTQVYLTVENESARNAFRKTFGMED